MPFLVEEKKVIKRSFADNRPYLVFCLGHQLLAEALGGKVGRNHKSSIGCVTGYLTHSGHKHHAFAGLPDCFPIFKRHTQTVKEPLPGHLWILVTSIACQFEAISPIDRPHILGLQFDNHSVSLTEVDSWLANDEMWLASLQDQSIDRNKIIGGTEQNSTK